MTDPDFSEHARDLECNGYSLEEIVKSILHTQRKIDPDRKRNRASSSDFTQRSITKTPSMYLPGTTIDFTQCLVEN